MKIYLSSKADRQLKKLTPKIYQIMLDKIEELGKDAFPEVSKKLMNRQGWRLRVGDYRILYTVDTKKQELTILSVVHRKEAYRIQN